MLNNSSEKLYVLGLPWQVIKNSLSNAGDAGSTPGQGAKIPHALWQKIKHKTSNNIKNSIHFKNDPHQKIKNKNYTCWV